MRLAALSIAACLAGNASIAVAGSEDAVAAGLVARMTLEESVRGVAELAPTLAADPETIEWCQVLGSSPSVLPVSLRPAAAH
jgi:hypothetical protein